MLKKTIYVDKKEVTFDTDTGAKDSFMSKTNWLQLGQPELQSSPKTYESAFGHNLPVLGVFKPQSVSSPKDNNYI